MPATPGVRLPAPRAAPGLAARGRRARRLRRHALRRRPVRRPLARGRPRGSSPGPLRPPQRQRRMAHPRPGRRSPAGSVLGQGMDRPRRRGRHRSHPLTDRTALRTPASTSPRRASGTSDLHPTRPRPPARPTQPAGHRHETTHSGPGATRRAAGERPGSSAAVLRARRGPGVYGPPARSPTPGEQFLEGERGLVVDGRDLDDGQARL